MPRRLSILHVIVYPRPTNGQINEHCLPFVEDRDISICSYFRSTVALPGRIKLFEGDGTLRGFHRALTAALADRTYDVVHAHAPVTGALLRASTFIGRRPISNAVCTIQNSFKNYSSFSQLLHYPVFASFPKVILCSDSVRDSLPRRLRRLGGSRIAVIPNGVDLDRVDAALTRANVTRRRDRFTVVSVGRLVDIKDPVTLLSAFATLPQGSSDLLYVGDGHMRQRLEDAAVNIGVADRVTFTGMVDRDDVYRHLAGGHVFVSTSLGEGLPVAVLEAMACRIPVVLSDISPHREIARGVDFIPLVPPGDVDGFTRAVERLSQMSSTELAELGDRCRQLVEQRFSLVAMHESYARIYSELHDAADGSAIGLRRRKAR